MARVLSQKINLYGVRMVNCCVGPGSVYDYQSILRQIRYVNTKLDSINRRTFVLSCTEAGKHVASNLLAVNVSDAPVRYFRRSDTLRNRYSSL